AGADRHGPRHHQPQLGQAGPRHRGRGGSARRAGHARHRRRPPGSGGRRRGGEGGDGGRLRARGGAPPARLRRDHPGRGDERLAAPKQGDTAVKRYTFTSESVTEGHPDKMADQISDAVLDAILAEDPMGRVACETLLTTGLAVIAGEITTQAYIDIPGIVRKTVCDIGYDRESYGFDGNTCGVITAIDEQSPDISQGVTTAHEVRTGK